MTQIELRKVTKTFGAKLILRDATCRFDAGTVSLITGENGAGKSTLLRIIAGLTAPTAGSVRITPDETRIGYLGHSTFLYPALTALENLAFWQKASGLASDRKTLTDMLGHVGLARHALTRAGVFSRGMKQRLSLARVLLQKPGILLLDEPGTGLDAASRQLLDEEIRSAAARGACVIAVSHDMEHDRELADAVYVIRDRVLEKAFSREEGGAAC